MSSTPGIEAHGSSQHHSNASTTQVQPGSASDDYREPGRVFPEGFLFGAATASYQIEGAANEDGRGPSIWDTFSATPGKVWNGDTGAVACDHYHRYEADLDLMQQLGLQSYRFSISWSRILPNGRGEVNQAGLDFYSRLVDGLIARRITPIATLYHWDLPQALEDEGGWATRATAYAFADYARVVGRSLGDRVAVWTTLNEPWCAAYLGYGSGAHAPGITDSAAALTAVHHLNLAHGLAITALKEVVTNDPKYSVTLNLYAIRPEKPSDAEVANLADSVANRVFLDPMLNGYYPELATRATAHLTDWSFIQSGDTEIINQPIDILGVNYYTPQLIRVWDGSAPKQNADGAPDSQGTAWPGLDHAELIDQGEPKTAMGWTIDPSGLEDLLMYLHSEWPDQALMITENGAAFDDEVGADGSVDDANRTDYLLQHFTAVHRAMQRGAKVTGYQVWSLLDNFEWSFGYAKRFGIVYVDFATGQRIPKNSALWYATLIRTGTVPPA